MTTERSVVLITGLGKPHRLRHGLVEIYDEIAAHMPSNTSVSLYRWGTVEKIFADLKDQQPREVMFAGHSYGVSSSAMVCQMLLEQMPEVVVSHFVSTDGIWRDKVDSPQFKSLFDGHRIAMPANVKKLYSFRQESGMLRGHGFDISADTDWVLDRVVVGVKHAFMDKLPAFRSLVIKLALSGKVSLA